MVMISNDIPDIGAQKTN